MYYLTSAAGPELYDTRKLVGTPIFDGKDHAFRYQPKPMKLA